MGILSPLMFAQQGAAPAAFNGLQWNGQAWVMPQAQPPAPQPAPRINAPNAQPMQSLSAPMSPLAQMPGAANVPEVRPSWSSRVNDAIGSPLFQTGLSLLGNAQNGGNWAQVGQDVRAINADQQQRRLLEEQQRRQRAQDRREETTFSRQQTEWGLADQQRRDWEAALGRETDPQRQAQLRAMGPQGYGEFIARERQMEFQAREGQLDRDAQMRAASLRAANENPLGRMFQSMDAQQLGAMNQRSSVLAAQTLPALRQVRENILQAGQAATGQPIDYNTRIVLNRVFNGQGADRQALETWRARILRPALEMLPPGPATDRDVALVMENFANPNMQLGSALSLIDERIAAAEREVMQAQAANEFFGTANGLTGTRNAAGQDWPTFLSERLSNAPGIATTPQNAIPRGGYAPPPAAAIAELRRDTSAAARREFDETFGPGAAQRALAGGGRNAAADNRRLTGGLR